MEDKCVVEGSVFFIKSVKFSSEISNNVFLIVFTEILYFQSQFFFDCYLKVLSRLGCPVSNFTELFLHFVDGIVGALFKVVYSWYSYLFGWVSVKNVLKALFNHLFYLLMVNIDLSVSVLVLVNISANQVQLNELFQALAHGRYVVGCPPLLLNDLFHLLYMNLCLFPQNHGIWRLRFVSSLWGFNCLYLGQNIVNDKNFEKQSHF